MSTNNSHLIAAVAGGVGLAFVGYCIYFDQKRRNDPEFKRKLIEKRRNQRKAQAEKNSTQYPDLLDEMAVQQFFMKEIALGEQLMGLGDIENGIEHLANAVAVTAHKENLLNVLRTTLPDPIFRLLVERLPFVTQKIYASYKARTPEHTRNKEPKIVDVTDTEPVEVAIDECLD